VFDQAHLRSLCRLRQFLFSLNWWESYFRQIGGAGWHQNSALSVMCGKSLLIETYDYFNGTNRKFSRNGTLLLDFSKLKPQTLRPQPLNTHPLTQAPTSNSRTLSTNPKSSSQILLSNFKPPPQNWKHMPFFPTFPFAPLLPVPFLLDTNPQYINWRKIPITPHCWNVNQLNKILM